MSRDERIADFKRRVSDDLGSVYELGEHGRFITVNPMSDEQSLLDRLAIHSESCIKVDLYWERRGDVMFVQIQSIAYSNERPVGAYVRRTSSGYLNVVIVTADRSISSVRVADELRGIAPVVAALDPRAVAATLTALSATD